MKIVILQPMLKVYRVSLYTLLYQQLTEQGHELRIVFGTPSRQEQLRGDNIILDNNFCFFEKSYWLFTNKLHILPKAVEHILWADLVITEQANKHLHNYLLLVLRWILHKPYAFWGHGLNRQATPHSINEFFKKKLAKQTDWWFAYTQSVADYLQALDFNKNHITVLNNSIDTLEFKQALQNTSTAEIQAFKQQYNIAEDAQIALFCGSLHQYKKIDFLLNSAESIKEKLPKFVLLVGGTGEESTTLANYASHDDFIIPIGWLNNKTKSLAFKCAEMLLNPGMVGLVILDAFCAGLPLLTTKQNQHSPEIDYLQHDFNGLICEFDQQAYVELVVSTFSTPEKLTLLQHNALLSSEAYSIEKMAENFANGIANFSARRHSKQNNIHNTPT